MEAEAKTTLLEAARRGDEAAFQKLMLDHRSSLRAHCYRLLGGVADAEDALQEALLAAWQGLGGFERRSTLRTWLFTIATHAYISSAFARKRALSE